MPTPWCWEYRQNPRFYCGFDLLFLFLYSYYWLPCPKPALDYNPLPSDYTSGTQLITRRPNHHDLNLHDWRLVMRHEYNIDKQQQMAPSKITQHNGVEENYEHIIVYWCLWCPKQKGNAVTLLFLTQSDWKGLVLFYSHYYYCYYAHAKTIKTDQLRAPWMSFGRSGKSLTVSCHRLNDVFIIGWSIGSL